MSEFLLKPVPNEEAAEFISGKAALSRRVFDRMLPEIKARAFTITGIERATVLQRVRDRIAELPRGADWDEIKGDVAAALGPYFLDESADEDTQALQLDAANRRAELLIRTHGFQAYQAAQYQVMQETKDALPYWQYLTMDDEAVRPEHEALNGLILPADSPFWKDHFPPWDWGCRCQVVPITQEDFDQVANGEAQFGRVLSAVEQREIEQNGRLALGNGQVISVASPWARGKEGAYRWDPGSLRIPLDQLKDRYDADVWADFEKAMRAENVAEGVSVWDWLDGKNVAGGAGAVPVFAPQPAVPAATPPATQLAGPVAGDAQSPVSSALQLPKKGKLAGVVKAAVAAIDKVHRDGKLPAIPVTAKAGKGNLGSFSHSFAGRPVKIGVKPSGPWPQLTACHEIGHFLDLSGIDTPGTFASVKSPLLEQWRQAIDASRRVAEIRDNQAIPDRESYWLTRHELFARSYAQYVAEKSSDPGLAANLQKVAGGMQPWRQWDPEDFKPIREAFDSAFTKMGWL